MSYVDGFVAAVPKANKQTYLEHATSAAKLFREYGALKIVENWEADVPDGETTSFPMAVQRKADEAIVFSWVAWPSKEARDAAWQKIMEDERMNAMEMPFDGARMIYGGFETIMDV